MTRVRMDPVTAVLVRARARIAEKRRWTRHTLARDGRRFECPAPHPVAVRWCAVGALQAECTTVTPTLRGWHFALNDRLLRAARDRLEQAVGGRDVTVVNDRRGHAAVLAMYDEAIRRK